MIRCDVRRAGDSTWCETCGLRWDTNDEPPSCRRELRELPWLTRRGHAAGLHKTGHALHRAVRAIARRLTR